MANRFFTNFFAQLMAGSIKIASDSLKVGLVNADYTFNAADTTCANMADAIIASASITGATVSGATAVFPATAVTGVDASLSVAGVVVYKDTGAIDTSIPLFFVDTATGLPLTTNGQTVTVTFGNPTINLNSTT